MLYIFIIPRLSARPPVVNINYFCKNSIIKLFIYIFYYSLAIFSFVIIGDRRLIIVLIKKYIYITNVISLILNTLIKLEYNLIKIYRYVLIIKFLL